MNNESGIKHRMRAIEQFISDPRLRVYCLLILVAGLTVTEMAEVFYFPLFQPLPKWTYVAFHFILLAVFIHYIRVYLKYRSYNEKLLGLNDQLQRQITEIRRAEERLLRCEYIISTTSDLMSMVDRNYIYQAVNNAYLRAHNKNRNEIVGHTVAELLSEKVFQELVKEHLDQCFKGATVKYQEWFDYGGIGRRYMDVSYYPFSGAEGYTSDVVVVARDITEHKLMEEELKKHSQELEAKVRERTAKLEEKTIQAAIANRAKTEFLSNMSHELRTPLNSIIGFTELLKNGVAGALTGEQNDYLKSVWESGKHLHRIIDDIFAMTEIESDSVALEPGDVPLKETIEGILRRFSGKAERQGIRMNADIPDDIGHITADEKKIRQVIQNLLGNAFKFTPEGGSVRVAARRVGRQVLEVRSNEIPELRTLTSELDGDFIEISVADTGIGIAKEDMSRLFRPFQQLSPTLTKGYEGVGVSLSICRKYIELHGGTIWVESEVGKGSKFAFVVPVR